MDKKKQEYNCKMNIMKRESLFYGIKLWLGCILSSGLVSLQAQTLTHSYTFEDGTWSGITVNDQVGTANGTINGSDWEIKKGYFVNHNANYNTGTSMGGYISFDGTALALNTYSAITLEAYISTNGDMNNPNHWCVLAYFGGAAGANSFMMNSETGSTTSRAILNNTNSATGAEPAANETHHYVAVLVPSTASTAGYVKWYIDGTIANTTALAMNTFNAAVSAIATTNAWLGKSAWPDPLYTAAIHEFNIYNGELNATQVSTHYASMNTKLATLTVDAGTLSPVFNANVYNYGVVISAGTNTLNVTATAASSTNYPTVSGAGACDVSGTTGTIVLKASSTGTPYTIYWSKAVSTPVITHSYTFDGTANDVVGTANGTKVGAAATITNGVFTTNAGATYLSGNSQYISLPAASLGIQNYPAVSFEVVGKTSTGVANFFSYFGNQTLGGDLGGVTKGVGTDYVFQHTSSINVSCNENGSPYNNNSKASGTDLIDNKVHHIVGIMTMDNVLLYQDGTLKATTTLSNVNRLFNISNKVAYLGRSGYTLDNNLIGSIGEFNIWKGQLDASTITSRSNSYLKNADLSTLTVSVGTLTFNPATTSYTVLVPNGTTSVDVAATVNRDFVTLTGTGTVTLTNSTAQRLVVVTSADGSTTKTYTVNFTPHSTWNGNQLGYSTCNRFRHLYLWGRTCY